MPSILNSSEISDQDSKTPFKTISKQFFWRTLTSFVILTLTAILVFGAFQFTLRSSANDTPNEISEQISKVIKLGQTPNLGYDTINPKTDSSPFVIVFDDQKKEVVSNLKTDNQTPNLPSGVLDEVDKKGINSISWEPEKGTRLAVTIKKVETTKKFYVLTGQSLTRAENKIKTILYLVIGFWLVGIIAITLIELFRPFKEKV